MRIIEGKYHVALVGAERNVHDAVNEDLDTSCGELYFLPYRFFQGASWMTRDMLERMQADARQYTVPVFLKHGRMGRLELSLVGKHFCGIATIERTQVLRDGVVDATHFLEVTERNLKVLEEIFNGNVYSVEVYRKGQLDFHQICSFDDVRTLQLCGALEEPVHCIRHVVGKFRPESLPQDMLRYCDEVGAV